MKRIFTLLFIVSVLSINSFAQNKTGAAYGKGNSVVSAGYGIGNIWKTLFVSTTNFPGGNYKISSTGPFSLTYEYGITKRISAGFILGYTNIKRLFYFSTYTNTEKFSNFSAMARANYHFGRSKKIDPYIGIGLGYYKFTYSSTDDSGSTTPLDPVNIPGSFGYSGQLGARYYFVPHFGLFAEIGYVAGSYAQIGLITKF